MIVEFLILIIYIIFSVLLYFITVKKSQREVDDEVVHISIDYKANKE
jgi:hypothetical protein